MARPANLPEFRRPPLDEVAIGVQFSPLRGYTSVLSKAIWDIYRDEFPIVQELPPLEPAFETFGGSNPAAHASFRFGTGPVRSRLWFLSRDDSHLIQFQEDKLLLNWRRRDTAGDYPRFETIFSAYSKYIDKLNRFSEKEFGMPLGLNQAEITYFNVIAVDSYEEAGKWLNFVKIPDSGIENLTCSFSKVTTDEQGHPEGRLTHELQSVVSKDGKQKALRLALTFRGKPKGSQIGDYLDFLAKGRAIIVNRFGELGTDFSRKIWERAQ